MGSRSSVRFKPVGERSIYTDFIRLQKLPLASVDFLVVLGIIIRLMFAIWMQYTWMQYNWVAISQIPYFVWGATASLLQLSMTWMNFPS